MLKKLTLAILAAATFFASPAMAQDEPKVGGEYQVTWYHGLPTELGGNPSNVVRLTTRMWEQLAYLDHECRGESKSQRPNALAEVFHTTFVGALSGAAGTAAAYQASQLGPVGPGAIYGAAAGGVGGFIGGLDNRGRAKRYDIGQCMYWQVVWAQKYDGVLQGVSIKIMAYAVNGKHVKRPDGSVMNPHDRDAAAQSDSPSTARGSDSDTPSPVAPQ